MGGVRMGGANATFANRGAMSRGGMPGGASVAQVGGFGGARGGGFGGGGRGGGGAEGGVVAPICASSTMRVLLGRLDERVGYYRFVYNGGHTAYVVMAQEVQTLMPEAVTRGTTVTCAFPYRQARVAVRDLRPVGLGAHLPSATTVAH